MTTIYHDSDADLDTIRDSSIAVVGYGNQGRSWALNLRDEGLDVTVCVRDDDTRKVAEQDGFKARELTAANEADILCVLVPDDAIPELPIQPSGYSLTIVASGFTLAFGRFDPNGDVGMIAPRMLGPEVRECYLEGVGFITAVGVAHDRSGSARDRLLAVAKAIGGLRQGAIELTPMQEAVLDLAVEQVLSPALARVNTAFLSVMAENGIPLEATMTELFLSGEIERTYRRLRLEGFAGQLGYHSPTSQYGQLSRRGTYDHLDVEVVMRELTDAISSGRFADEWDAERAAGHEKLAALKDEHAGPLIQEFEADLRRRLGELADPEPNP
jgi:ketol-acid reductoisomerase